MKRFFWIMIAVLTAAVLVLSGCGGKDTNKSGDKAGDVTPAPSLQIADGTGYDNSVVIADGSVEGTAFNWQFFLGKSGAGRAAEIKITSKNGGSSEDMMLTGGKGSYTLTRGSNEQTFTYLLSFTADFPASTTYSMAEISVITNNPDITIEQFFGGVVPEDVRVGDSNENGVVVFVNYAKK